MCLELKALLSHFHHLLAKCPCHGMVRVYFESHCELPILQQCAGLDILNHSSVSTKYLATGKSVQLIISELPKAVREPTFLNEIDSRWSNSVVRWEVWIRASIRVRQVKCPGYNIQRHWNRLLDFNYPIFAFYYLLIWVTCLTSSGSFSLKELIMSTYVLI